MYWQKIKTTIQISDFGGLDHGKIVKDLHKQVMALKHIWWLTIQIQIQHNLSVKLSMMMSGKIKRGVECEDVHIDSYAVR